jgi:uncharacterized damage-inducible protein DinB
MAPDEAVRKQITAILRKSEAHAGFEKSVQDFPPEKRGVRPPGSPHSAWELLEHLRIAQEDILEFCASTEYEEKNWPDDYWPKSAAPASDDEWNHSVQSVIADREAFIALLNDSHRDLYTPFAWGDGQTLLREALLIIDHNAYHIGEIVLLRRLLGAWS